MTCCSFDVDVLFVYNLEYGIEQNRSNLFGPWGDPSYKSRQQSPCTRKSKKNPKKGKRRSNSEKGGRKQNSIRAKFPLYLEQRAYSTFPSSYMRDYAREKEDLGRKRRDHRGYTSESKSTSVSGNCKKQSTDVKLCDYQDLTKLKHNLPSLSQTILKYDAEDINDEGVIPPASNGLHPRPQLKPHKKPGRLSVPYSDHLAHHINELKASSICTIIEPRDPRSFKSSCSSTNDPLTGTDRRCPDIKSYSIDQQKDRLGDFLLNSDDRNNKTSLSISCSNINSSSAVSNNSRKEKSVILPSFCRRFDINTVARNGSPHGGTVSTANSVGQKCDFASRQNSTTFMWQAPLSYDIGPGNVLPDIHAVVKITEKAMKDAFLDPAADKYSAMKDKTPIVTNSMVAPRYKYNRLIELTKPGKTTYKNFSLARELTKLSAKAMTPAAARNAGGRKVGITSSDCIYCKLIMRRLDLYQTPQFGVTTERMLIYKRMQKQANLTID